MDLGDIIPHARKLDDLIRWMAAGKFQTTYEKRNGIVAEKVDMVFDSKTCKILMVMKSDGTESLFLLLRCSLKSDYWFYSPLFDDMVSMMLEHFPIFWERMKAKEKKKLAEFMW